MAVIKSLIASAAIFMGSTVGLSADGRLFQTDDLHKIQDVGAPSLSADGSKVAYTVSGHNIKIDATVSDVWLVPYSGGKARNLTKTKEKSEWAPQFSPDGKKIAYLGEGKKDSGTQIFMMSAKGRGSRQISNVDGGVIAFSWAPDSKQIVLTAFVGGAKKSEAGTAAPIVIDRFQFKEDWVGYLAGARRHLHTLDVESKKSVQITKGDVDHWLPSWSPDGKWIAFVSKDQGDADRNMDSDVFIMAPEVEAGKIRISTSKGTDVDPYWASPPAWSPDSKKLVWLTSGDSKWIYYMPWQLTIGDITSGHVQEIGRIDRSFYMPKWSGDGKSIYSLVEQDRVTHVAKVTVETGKITYLEQGQTFDLSYDVAANDNIVTQQSNDNTPFELVALEGVGRALTAHNSWLAEYNLAVTERFDYSSDGHDIGGFITYPQGYDKTKSYPTIFRLHGGPVYQFSHEFMYDWQIYASQGYIVVGINPRGSSGKGFDFSKAIYADWGNVDVKDILVGADYLATKGIIDPDRLAVGGWSYGGMLTNYVIATDTRFKAAVSGAGMANAYGNYGDDQYTREYELELGTPWGNREAYDRVSFPFLHADRIKTPTLYQCSEKDFNVPCIGAEQMYQALRSLEVNTQFIIYPNQHHGINVPSYLADRMQRNLEWYGRYTKGKN